MKTIEQDKNIFHIVENGNTLRVERSYEEAVKTLEKLEGLSGNRTIYKASDIAEVVLLQIAASYVNDASLLREHARQALFKMQDLRIKSYPKPADELRD